LQKNLCFGNYRAWLNDPRQNTAAVRKNLQMKTNWHSFHLFVLPVRVQFLRLSPSAAVLITRSNKMIKKKIFLIGMGVLFLGCYFGCQSSGRSVGVDEKEVQGFKTKTFFDNSENIEVITASDGKSTIVAVPKAAINRRNQMSDEEYQCLKACKDIADLEKRLNCILLCPVSKKYQVFIF
jgi:hypothetical protein